MNISPTYAFAGFALLLAARDILSELYLHENGLSLAFLNCMIIASISGFLIVATGRVSAFLKKMRHSRVLTASLILGASASIVYGVTFFMLKEIGAGLFDLIDYGLAPILTAIVGIAFFSDTLKPQLILAFVSYLAGLLLLKLNKPMVGWELVALAIVSPLATALSDGLTKWLLAEDGGRLTRTELLLVRFLPASLIVYFAAPFFDENALRFQEVGKALLVTVLFGFGPLWLLCTALVQRGLSQLAMWEFIIPGLAFFGTLPAHMDEHGKFLPILGACLVIAALLIGESKILSKLFGK